MTLNLTPEQHAAVTTHDHNLIVVAGAGSGKTYVLVQRFIALLQATDWPLKALVAITFTRKAAGEMRARVRAALEQHYRAAADADSQTRWAALMAEMDSARINTIHGLCAEILRANAAEARLDPDFTVLEEIDAALMLDQAVSDALNAAADLNGHASQVLFSEYPISTLRDTLKNVLPLSAPLPDVPADLLALWQADYLAQFRAYLERSAAVFTSPQAIYPLDDATRIKDKLYPYIETMLAHTQALMHAPDDTAKLEALHRIAAEKKPGGTGSKDAWGDAVTEIRAWLKGCIDCAKEFVNGYGSPSSETDARAAALLPAWVALVQEAQERYNALKDAANGLDFEDLEARTAALLRDFPNVRARYADEIRHIMVDEFQDTNHRQWDIVRLLAGDRAGGLFVVGDPKQSIYAFRGADVSVFEDTRQAILTRSGQSVDLKHTFRTHRGLIATFNTFFARALTRDESSIAYRYQVGFDVDMLSGRDAPCDEAAVELVLIDREKLKDGASVDAREWEAYALASRLRALVQQARPIYDRAIDAVRPVRYGDMALLLRSMTYVNIYEKALRALGVPFVTVAGRGYYDRQEVRDLLNLLQALYTPADELALAAALRSPLFGVSDEALYALRVTPADAPPVPLWQSLMAHAAQPGPLMPPDQVEAVGFAYQTLHMLRQLSGRVTIAELLRAALRETGFLATLSALPDGDQRRSNVEKLMQKALVGGRIALPDFVAYLQDMNVSEVHEGDAALDAGDAVQIMTIHKSKGLEFPVVAMAETNATANRRERAHFSPEALACKVRDDESSRFKGENQPYAWRKLKQMTAAQEEAETLRLLYVAMTRAADLLILTASTKRNKDGELTASSGSFFATLMQHGVDSCVGVTSITPETPPHYRDLMPAPRPEASAGADSADVFTPPLLGDIVIAQEARARYLSASNIEDLGAVDAVPEQSAYYRGRFRRQVLYDAPDEVKRPTDEMTSQRHVSVQLGEVVHRALQFWQVPSPTHASWNKRLAKMLVGYAWDAGLNLKASKRRLERAMEMLHRFRASSLYTEIEHAAVVYRELPFVYQHDDFIVRGIIDVLYRTPAGEWVIVDYKTSRVPSTVPGQPTDAELEKHARRYHLQVGVYASAVYKRLGVYPRTRVHYVQYDNPTVDVPEAAWRAALTRTLSQRVQAVILDEERG